MTPTGPGVLYFGVEGGWTHLNSPTDSVGGFKFKEHFDDGFNAGARAGYEWGPLRFEEEFNFAQNRLNRFSGPGFSLAAHGQRNRYAIMTNAIYDFPLGWIFSPHVGVGIGGARHNISALSDVGYISDGSTGFGIADKDQVSWTMAWAIHAGLALLAAHAFSRGALPVTMHLLSPARTDGLGYTAGRPSRTVALIGAGIGIAIAISRMLLSFGARARTLCVPRLSDQ